MTTLLDLSLTLQFRPGMGGVRQWWQYRNLSGSEVLVRSLIRRAIPRYLRLRSMLPRMASCSAMSKRISILSRAMPFNSRLEILFRLIAHLEVWVQRSVDDGW